MKKAQMIGLVSIILLLATVIAALLLIKSFQKGYNFEKHDALCKASILVASKGEGIISFQCPALKVEITSTEVEQGIAFSLIAERLKACWDYFGQGKNDPLTKKIADLGVDTACKVCAKIRFKGVKEGKLEGFHDYLSNPVLKGSASYAEYLYGEEDFANLVPDAFKTDEEYVVVYAYTNKPVFNMNPFSKDEAVQKVFITTTKEYSESDYCDYEFD